MSPVAVGQLYPGGLAGVPAGVGLRPSSGKVPKTRPGEVAFVTDRPAITLVCRLGAGTATAGGGVGGWNSVVVPGRTDGLEWRSIPGRTLTIPVLLDGLADRRSVEAEITALRTMGAPPAGSPRGTPPPVIRVGGMVPHDDREWVLTDLAEGEAIWDGQARIRLWATVQLAAYEDLAVVKVTAKKSGATAATRSYTVRAGESLGEIARDEMGAKTATAIAKGVAELKTLNGIRDAKAIRAGQKIKVPR